MINKSIIAKRQPDGKIWYMSSDIVDSEHDIFFNNEETEYVSFMDTDNIWYCVHMGIFIVKLPLDFVKDKICSVESYEFIDKQNNRIDEFKSCESNFKNISEDVIDEIDFWESIDRAIITYILKDYYAESEDFRKYMEENSFRRDEIIGIIEDKKDGIKYFCEKYYDVINYFDNWVLIKTDDTNSSINKIVLKKKGDKHIETSNWI
ncbi:MAG: hypothetical protein IJ141_09180 [Lachnospiraceae bacterium]|nr:hypothetical protein [Lachnospiraceae bacterium]